MAVHHVAVAGTHVEVEELGAGEPVVVVQTALTMRELEPLCRSLGPEHHVWHVHRPGYGGVRRAREPGSIEGDAELVASVMEQLGVGSAHLVGASYSAAVVLTLASRHRDRARSVVAVEPPPHGTPRAADFRAANERLREVYATSGPARALDQVMQIVDGPDWRVNAERDLRGSVAEMERDAGTFFASDVPALLGWRLDDGQAATIACPTLLVGGGDSHPWFAEMLDRLDRVLPRSGRVTIDGAGHTAALTHVDEVARVIRDHVRAALPE